MLAVALATGVASAALTGALARPGPPPIEIRTREPEPTATVLLFVHVDGAVLASGVYHLPADTRIFEAIDAAGGAAEEADLGSLNLAARVTDGQKLVIPTRASVSGSTSSTPITIQPVSPTGTSPARINLNTASQRILESLPGIGPVTAKRLTLATTVHEMPLRVQDAVANQNRAESLARATQTSAMHRSTLSPTHRGKLPLHERHS